MDFSSMLSQFKQNAEAEAERPKIKNSNERPDALSSTGNKRPRIAEPPTEEKKMPTVPVRTIYIVCPPRQQSGGPEAMHQLCDLLNTHPSINNAYMLYIQINKHSQQAHSMNTHNNLNLNGIQHFRSPSATPMAYRDYNCPPAPHLPTNSSNELIVYPECWTHLIDSFPQAQICIWWLSVDNNHSQFQQFHRYDILHLYQSHYAKHYLLSHMTPPDQIMEMTEYISPLRIPSPGAVESGFRDLDVLYNPSKGVHYTDAIRSRSEEGCAYNKHSTSSSHYNSKSNMNSNDSNDRTSSNYISSSTKMRFRPIGEGLGGRKRITPEEVTALLLRSKIYIDFGSHPGMDRLPREAALCGCIIITNGEGSAGFPQDYPIPNEYRIRTFDVDVIHDLLNKSLNEYEERRGSFDEYREWIMGQFDRMEECVNDFLEKIVDKRRRTNADGVVTGIGIVDAEDVNNKNRLQIGKNDDDSEEVRSYGNAKNKTTRDDSSLGSYDDNAF